MHEELSRPVETLHWGVTHRSAGLLATPALLPLGLVDETGEGAEWDPDLPGFETLEEAVAATGAEAVVVDGPPEERPDRVVRALALDLHVLAAAPLARGREEAQRCVLIAQNRGVRLMVADSQVYGAPAAAAAAFARFVLEGAEPPTSGRRWLAARDSQRQGATGS